MSQAETSARLSGSLGIAPSNRGAPASQVGSVRSRSWARFHFRLAAWLGPALLVVVAAVQRFHVEYRGQTTWLGGGFGMYASLDNMRFVRATARFGEHRVVAELPEAVYEVPARRVRVRPDTEPMQELANILLGLRWTGDREQPSVDTGVCSMNDVDSVSAVDGPSAGCRPDEVRIQLYQRAFDASSLRLRAVELAHATAVR